MITKIKILLATLSLSLGLAGPALLPAMASAEVVQQPNAITTNTCIGTNAAANNANGAGGCNVQGAGSGTTIQSVASKIVNLFSILVGAVAIIMIIYGGFRYITSGGDSGRVGSAKNTLIYAVIGLIIVALAQLIVHYVLTATTTNL